MTVYRATTRVSLRSVRDLSWGRTRRHEPVTFGVPLPRGLARTERDIGVEGPSGPLAVQVSALDRWPDQSIRWALLSFRAGADAAGHCDLVIGPDRPLVPVDGLECSETPGTIGVATGAVTFEIAVGGRFPLSGVRRPGGPLRAAQLRIGHEGRTFDFVVADLAVHHRGPLRAELEVRGHSGGRRGELGIEAVAVVEVFAGAPAARVAITIRNPRRARHAGGQWSLGDPGSILLDAATVAVDLGAPVDRVQYAAEPGETLADARLPLEIRQESSGGGRWNGPIHRNRDGRVPLAFRGYRVTSGEDSRSGLRASPIVRVEAGGAETTVALAQFWERFPSAIRVEPRTIEIGLLPRVGDLHELQGGEQMTDRVVLAFGGDAVTDPPLAWVHDPRLMAPDPAWVCRSDPTLRLRPVGEADGPSDAHVTIAPDAQDGFLAKRETADEYGWRNFGDLPADHESAFQPPDRPFVSHYNNQYDAVAAFALHFLRSGDEKWWRLMDDLARHVRDIDIYHTSDDKSAYNGGLFWHTAHYLDAGLSTHRTYPPGSGVSGGPSAEHNYNVGLMLHYFLTGEQASRRAAIGLGTWVIAMDDGRRTPFRWVTGGPTGHASLTRDYHGPGRGAGHSILACLVAARLSGDPRFGAKADQLIARVIHPQDDIASRELLDTERRWSYTVFLQVLGLYLDRKAEREEFDDRYHYAQESLLQYARWMADHERPYLERRDELEFPTETWVAQDLRKADVFLWAALQTDGSERDRFLERARFFLDYVRHTLGGMPERRFTRPMVLVLGNSLRLEWLRASSGRLPPARRAKASRPLDPPRVFVPQRDLALRRAGGLALLTAAAALGAWLMSG